MSFSPSINMVRLHELKLWQGSYDNLLEKTRSSPKAASETPPKQTVSNSNIICLESDSVSAKDWDKRRISPSKPFEQLLEEKLAEDTPVVANPKPKKPFLKKGQGLARFRINNAGARNVPGNKRGPQKNLPLQRKSILKKNNPLMAQDVDLSPLSVPDFVKSRGTWKQVFDNTERHLAKNVENIQEDQEVLENFQEFRKSLDTKECQILYLDQKCLRDPQLFKSSSDTPWDSGNDDDKIDKNTKSIPDFERLNKEIMLKIKQNAKKYFNGLDGLVSNDIPSNFAYLDTSTIPKRLGDLTLEELKVERELKIFEALEQKVNSSSFCSTNTSIANLLASTPQKNSNFLKNNNKIIFEQAEEGGSSMGDSIKSMFPKNMRDDIQTKLKEVSEKTDVLQKFLINLQNMETNKEASGFSSLESDTPHKRDEKASSLNTSFSDENTRWSTGSSSFTDFCTELTETCHNKWKKVDACVNTSFDQSDSNETVKNFEPCKDCEALRSECAEIKTKLGDLKSENSGLKLKLKDFEKEFDKLKKVKKKDEETFEEKIDKLQNELDNERKRIAKEKAYFESYVKEAQNRPSKKEREEITRLKQELADIKELVKLKETKSGATQARLRTQNKQQEKELAELKITVDKLQKENAKLTASQKYSRRPQEVKMLHEINKNLSKLAEETFKKQLNKSGNVEKEGEEKTDFSSDHSRNKEKIEKTINNKEVQKTKINKHNFRFDNTALDETPPTDALSIERQYETVFGNVASPKNVSVSTNLEKVEKTLPDGSVETTYSNGNRKTISADGQTIRMVYFNGDSKETDLKEQIIRYHYASADSWHIQYPDGKEVMEFKDGQKCTKYIDGKSEISYPDGSVRIINSDGTEEQCFPDGRKTLKNLQGEQIILLPNGQREIHTQEYKRREYPDGTIRTLHKNGTVETVYANGRVRLKDSNGVLIMDTQQNN